MKNYSNLLAHQDELVREYVASIFYAPNNQSIIEALQICPQYEIKIHTRALSEVIRHRLNDETITISITEYITKFPVPRNPSKIAKELSLCNRSVLFYDKLHGVLENITHENIESSLSDSQKYISTLTSGISSEVTLIKPLMDEYAKFQEVNKNKNGLLGIPMGFPKLDALIDGLRAPHFIIIGGYTNLGKSALMLNMMVSVIRNSKKAVLYSLEMSKNDLITRMLSIMTGESGHDIMHGLSNEKIEDAKKTISESGLVLINEKRELGNIILSMHEQKLVNNSDVVFIDYLQQIYAEGMNTEYETMREVAIQFQKNAATLNVPIVCVSQVSNEAAKNPNSQVIGFKGSGTIASATDFAIELVTGEESVELHRQNTFLGKPVKINAIVKKNRHGRTGTVSLIFNTNTGTFTEYSDPREAFRVPGEPSW